MGSSWYKVSLSPIEFYHLGNEHSFRRNKDTYFASSDQVPSQTSIFGMIRYFLLKSNDLLGFDDDKKTQREKLIGSKSFSYDLVQDFGKIKQITSLQILSSDGKKVYIKRPNNLKRDDNGFKITDQQFETYEVTGENSQVYFKDFYGKTNSDGAEYLQLTLETKMLEPFENELFARTVKTRVNKVERLENKKKADGAFFKVEMYQLRPEYIFQFFLEVDDDVHLALEDIVFLGSYKSAFKIQLEKIEVEKKTEFEDKIKNVLTDKLSGKTPFHFALSDVYLTDTKDVSFSVNSKRETRNLSTQGGTETQPTDLKLLYGRGSVFYSKNSNFAKSNQAEKIGLNHLIKISKEQDNDREQ